MPIDQLRLRGEYARVKGLERAAPLVGGARSELADDFNRIVTRLTEILGEDLVDFQVPRRAYYSDSRFCDPEILRSKIYQLKSYLEEVFQVGSRIVEIGSLFNTIRDADLSQRCADLLSATGAFDRVINQATQVLEDRIRKKAGLTGKTGATLVGMALNSEKSKSILSLSDADDEHRGLVDVIRGIVAAFRNETHHQISERFSREEALQVCAFIDNLLRIVDQSTVLRKPD